MTDTWEFKRRAFCVRVVDGDTIDVFCDKQDDDYAIQRIRLANINCPEIHGATKAAGDIATAFTASWIDNADAWADLCVTIDRKAGIKFLWPLQMTTYKTDDFHRFVAVVINRAGDPVSLNDALLASGNAVPYMVNPILK